ncbi:hypothetical protein BJY59DRAFT_114112 [Rhodotorula toruloides]
MYPAAGDLTSSERPSFASSGTAREASSQSMLSGYAWPAYPPAPVLPSSQIQYSQGWQGWQGAAPPTSDARATVAGLGQLHALPDSGMNTPSATFFPGYSLATNDSYPSTASGGSNVEAIPETSRAVSSSSQYSPFAFDAQQQQSMQALFSQYSSGWPGAAGPLDPSSSTVHSLQPPYPFPSSDAPVDPAATTYHATGIPYQPQLYPTLPSASSALPSASRPVSAGLDQTFSILPNPSLPVPSLPPPLPSSSSLPFRLPAEQPSSSTLQSDLFASKRTRRASSAATATGMNLPAALGQAGDMVKANSNPNKKLTVDLPAVCVVCSEPIARLICRGKRAELNVPHAAAFTCLRCWESSNEASPMAEYSPETTTTALPAEDAGSPPVAGPSRRPSVARAKGPSFRRRNKRLDDRSTPTACDVCLRDIAVGGVLPLPLDDPPPHARIAFMIEVVCSSCDSRYRRCTDCGGGGGARAGTGKWRSKELFVQNRKTCVLNHQRLGAFPAMEYSVWRNTEIPRDEVDELSAQLKALFINAMLAGLCIPGGRLQDSCWRNPSLFLSLVLPWDPTGEIFDATSLMLSSLVQRADADIRALNAEKLARGEPAIPNLRHVWTMLFFKPSSRVLSSLIKKRGFMLLEDYLQAHPDTPATLFPPHRQIYLPPDRQQGWTILVRRQREHSDGTFLDDWGARRAADEERGKKKEIRAAAVAARERQQRNGG